MNELIRLVAAQREEIEALRGLAEKAKKLLAGVGTYPLIGGPKNGGGEQRFRAEVPLPDLQTFWEMEAVARDRRAAVDVAIGALSAATEHRTVKGAAPAPDTPAEAPRSSGGVAAQSSKAAAETSAPGPTATAPALRPVQPE